MMVIWNAMKERKYAVCGNFQMHDKRSKDVRLKQSYISQSTLNIDLILWHTQLIVYAVKC